MSKILITGKNGLCGKAFQRLCPDYDNNEFCFVGREYGDLTNEHNVYKMYEQIRPDYVIHTAAKVGGIGGNIIGPADYFYKNILMNTYMIHYAYRFNVKKFMAFSSVCVFPNDLALLQEGRMHDGPVYEDNFAYGYAKRMVDIQIEAYSKQHGLENYVSIIPTNIYGPNDLYNLQHGHVIPSLVHKLYLANKNNEQFFIWGDGNSLREFIYVDDLAITILELLLSDKQLPKRIIISDNKQYSIKDVVNYLVEIADFKGQIIYDKKKPNGQRSRPSDISLLKSLFSKTVFSFTSLDKGLELSYNWFVENYPNVRGI
jgi:GDP-L-fucose synthase